MLGEQFIVGDEICGAVISIRPTEDIVSIWNRTATNDGIVGKIRSEFSQSSILLPSLFSSLFLYIFALIL